MKLRFIDSVRPNKTGVLDGLVDPKWHDDECQRLADYLESATPVGYALSRTPECTMCDFVLRQNLTLTDGVYEWSQILSHYVGAHKVRLPESIVDDMLNRLDELRAAPKDLGWWRDQMNGVTTLGRGLRALGSLPPNANDDLEGLVDPTWSDNESEALSDYLRFGTVLDCDPETESTCTMCRFTLQNQSVLTDGTYVWSQILFHYVGAHKVHLPELAVSDILNRFHGLDEADLDWDWWQALLGGNPAESDN